MHPASNDIGAYIKQEVGLKPINSAASATNKGAAIDRLGFDSGVLHAMVGAAAGGPSAQSAIFKLQESDTTTDGDFADVTGASLAAMTADNASGYLDINLQGFKRYIRVVCTVALTSGSTPTLPVAATITLGGGDSLPAA
jgi:hypothetical protein